jgi:hypothetical protein
VFARNDQSPGTLAAGSFASYVSGKKRNFPLAEAQLLIGVLKTRILGA